MKTRLTLKDVIETLAIYDIEHCRFPHNYLADAGMDIPNIAGLCINDKKLILIDKEQGDEELKETIIHELIHAKHYKKGDLKNNRNYIERHVQAETVMTYLKLYGVKP